MTQPRPMPSSIASEREVLGVCLLTQTTVEVASIVQPADFYHPAHPPIFEAMLQLEHGGKPIDALTVAQTMGAAGTLDKLRAFDGQEYLVKLQAELVSVENVGYHASVVAKKAERRRVVMGATEIAAAGLGDDDDDEFMARAEKIMLSLQTSKRASKGGPKHIKAYMRQLTDQLGERAKRRREGLSAVSGISTSFDEYDHVTAGLQRGELTIVAARPSMGKSSWARAVAVAVAKQGIPVLVFSLEMSGVSMSEAMVSSDARVDSQRLRKGELEIQHWKKVTSSVGDMVVLPIYIDESGAVTIEQIRSETMRWRACDVPNADQVLVVVDYLQLAQGSSATMRSGSREQQVSEVSRGLKLLAQALKSPVVALSQLNRAVENREDKRPRMADIRESGSIEQDADVVTFIYRDEVYSKDDCAEEDKGVAEVIIGKQRMGPLATVRLAWLAPYTRFENLSPRGAY